MSLYSTPAENAANAPATWTVRRRPRDVVGAWEIVDRNGSQIGFHRTKAGAIAEMSPGGRWYRLWDDERRWMAGEKVNGWKPYVLPLCPECMGAIGGACGGPDAPYRPAKPGEPCGAADHEDGEPDAYEVWNATGEFPK